MDYQPDRLHRKVLMVLVMILGSGSLSQAFIPHRVQLKWSASTTPGVTYSVYRGTVSGGPYVRGLSGVVNLYANDSTVHAGSTYYYVTTAVDSNGLESVYSNEVQAVIPTP